MLQVKRIPEKTGFYLTGFADAEGSFSVSFNNKKDDAIPWQILLCFKVLWRDKVILALFKRHLKCGTLRSGDDDVWHYEVNNFNAIQENIIPFFRRFGFLSAKKKGEFSKFRKLAKLLQDEEHLTKEGLKKILKLRAELNEVRVEKYSDSKIFHSMPLGKSSETICQADMKQ
jgi:hypothetical protein